MTICGVPVKGTHLRIVKVDTCGVPVTGVDSLVVVTKGFVQVEMEPQYEDGEEFFERNADGQACLNQQDPPTLKRFQLSIDMCEVNPAATSYIVDGRLLTEGAAVTGTGFAAKEGEPLTRFSLEVWQRVGGSGACDASGVERFVYHAWPNVGDSQIGTYTIENGRSTLQFIALTRAASLLWGDGPGATSWLPAGEVVETGEHWLWNITTTPLPTESCIPGTL